MEILRFPRDIQSNTQSNPIQTNIWTFDIANRVVSLRLDFWDKSNAPSQDHPLQFQPDVLVTAMLIDWVSGRTYGPRALTPESVSLDYEHHLPEAPGV